MTPVFFDTNILVYMHDPSAPVKRRIALQLFRDHKADRSIVLSTQILQEFHAAMTRRFPKLKLTAIKAMVADLARLTVLVIQPRHILDAISLQDIHRLSFWDSLVLEAAKETGAPTLLSEGLADGRNYDGVTVRNPFMDR